MYTSVHWSKAVGYAVPHLLPGSPLLTRVVALMVVPGSTSVVGRWLLGSGNWEDLGGGRWAKRPRWQIVADSPDIIDRARVPGVLDPHIDARRDMPLDSTCGAFPWTNVDFEDGEEQSSAAHLAVPGPGRRIYRDRGGLPELTRLVATGTNDHDDFGGRWRGACR